MGGQDDFSDPDGIHADDTICNGDEENLIGADIANNSFDHGEIKDSNYENYSSQDNVDNHSKNQHGQIVKRESQADLISDSTVSQTGRRGWKKYLGISLTLTSGFLYALAAIQTKILKDYHPLVVSIWRFQGVIWPCIVVLFIDAVCRKSSIFNSVWPLTEKTKLKAFLIVHLRGLVGCWAVVLQFYSFHYLDVADSTVITSSTSVFVTLMAHCFIGEKCAVVPIITAILTFGGVFIISRPPVLTGKESFDMNIVIGVLFAFGCMVISAAVLVMQRQLRHVHYGLVSLSSGIWGTIQCIIVVFAMNAFEMPKNTLDYGYATALAFTTFLAQVAITVALKFEQAGPVAIVQSCDVMSAFFWQYIFLKVVPDKFSIIGASIIVVGLLLISTRKYISTLPRDHPTRHKFRILLK